MAKATKRTWVPPATAESLVKQWTWTRSEGLWTEYLDGLKLPSDWGTLAEFLRAVREGREQAREVTHVTR